MPFASSGTLRIPRMPGARTTIPVRAYVAPVSGPPSNWSEEGDHDFVALRELKLDEYYPNLDTLTTAWGGPSANRWAAHNE